jgi:hypothetical protein
MTNPNWYITITNFGYSDWMISPHGHEQLSGEWGAAVIYDEISIGEAMWLEPNWIYPDWTSNSEFEVITYFTSWDDGTNPVVGRDTGQGVISNGQVEITIDCTMREGRALAGLTPGVDELDNILSHWYVMLETYTVRNITAETLHNVALFQLMHGQPNDDYGPNNYGVYDPTPYSHADDNFGEYHYDITLFSPDANWYEFMDDIVGFSGAVQPDAWGLGEFPDHVGEPGPTSLHHLVEADALPFGSVMGPCEVAGAMKWVLGDLGPGEEAARTVLFFTAHSPAGLPPQTALILLGPELSTNDVGSAHSVTATVTLDGVPIPGVTVNFEIIDGPHAGTTATAVTDGSGIATFTYTGSAQGTDLIVAHGYVDDDDTEEHSNVATKVWVGEAEPEIYVDIKPTSCPNPLNVKSKGVLPVAILGTENFDVTTVDPESILLEGISPLRYDFEDVATPFEGELCDCHELGPDGYMDMTLKFDTQAMVAALGLVSNREYRELTLTAMTYEGASISGQDCVWIISSKPTLTASDADGTALNNSWTRVCFTLEERAEVSLVVYDVTGRKVRDLASTVMERGEHTVEWNGRDDAGNTVASGIYFCCIKAGDISDTVRIVHLR